MHTFHTAPFDSQRTIPTESAYTVYNMYNMYLIIYLYIDLEAHLIVHGALNFVVLYCT